MGKICSHSEKQQKASLIKGRLEKEKKKKNKDSTVDLIVRGVTPHANSFISTRTASAQGV